jgi:hypothetical protein
MDMTGLKEKEVLRYIQEGEMFLNSISLNDSSLDDGEEGYIQLVERIGNVLLNPEYIVLKKMLYEAIVAAIDNLPYKENHIILDYCGLKRHEDWFVDVDNPLSKESIAARFHLGTEQAVDKTFRRAVKVLKAELEWLGWLQG